MIQAYTSKTLMPNALKSIPNFRKVTYEHVLRFCACALERRHKTQQSNSATLTSGDRMCNIMYSTVALKTA
jgi:hypothetical protein